MGRRSPLGASFFICLGYKLLYRNKSKEDMEKYKQESISSKE